MATFNLTDAVYQVDITNSFGTQTAYGTLFNDIAGTITFDDNGRMTGYNITQYPTGMHYHYPAVYRLGGVQLVPDETATLIAYKMSTGYLWSFKTWLNDTYDQIRYYRDGSYWGEWLVGLTKYSTLGQCLFYDNNRDQLYKCIFHYNSSLSNLQFQNWDSFPLIAGGSINSFSIHSPINWQPFPYLSGNNGQFEMELSQIKQSIIGDGSTQASSADPSDFYISRRSSLYNLSVNMLDGQEYTIAYCGDNYLTCTKRTVVGTQSTSVYLTLKFYFRSDTLIYTTPEIQITRVGTTAPNDYYLSLIYDPESEIAAPDLINEIFVVSDNVYYYNNWALPSETQMQALYIWLQDNGNAQSGDPYSTGSTDDGGDPNGPRPMDNINDSSLPTTGGLNLSIVTLYTPTDTELSAISAFLWSNDVLDNFKKYFNNFADNILCLYSLPFKPSGTLPTKAFKVGNITSDNPTLAAVEYCTVRYFDVDMGSYELKSKWGSYLDYSPYTKIEIYLPYIGLHALDIDELMSPSKNDGTLPADQGCTLSLVYRLDIITGIIVAKIKVNGQIRYQFTGKVGTTIPLTGQTYSNLVNSIITAGAGLATTIATGGLTAPMSAAATVTATIQAQKPQVTSVGNITGDASMLATDVPYLRISTPNKPLLEDQQVFTGFPSYKAGTLSDFTGYTEVVNAHVEGISCTEEERAKILTYLKDGVII